MRIAAGLLIATCVACSDSTDIVVSVSSDLSPQQMDLLKVSIQPVGGPAVERDFAPPVLPTTIRASTLMVPEPGVTVLIRVSALRTRSLVLQRGAMLPFVKGRALLLRLPLLRSCAGVPCASNETCNDRQCAPLPVEPNTLGEAP